MPPELVEFLARAFERTSDVTDSAKGKDIVKERAEVLLHALGMVRKDGRPNVKVDNQEVHEFVAKAIIDDPKFSETKLKKKVADVFGISETKALEFVKPTAFVPKLLRSNKLGGLVAKRDSKD